MRNLRAIEEKILANGRVDTPELEMLRKELYADGKIDRQEADFLVELHKRVQHRTPAFEHFFYAAIKHHILADGRIDAEEAAWLRRMLFADGKIDDQEAQVPARTQGRGQAGRPRVRGAVHRVHEAAAGATHFRRVSDAASPERQGRVVSAATPYNGGNFPDPPGIRFKELFMNRLSPCLAAVAALAFLAGPSRPADDALKGAYSLTQGGTKITLTFDGADKFTVKVKTTSWWKDLQGGQGPDRVQRQEGSGRHHSSVASSNVSSATASAVNSGAEDNGDMAFKAKKKKKMTKKELKERDV